MFHRLYHLRSQDFPGNIHASKASIKYTMREIKTGRSGFLMAVQIIEQNFFRGLHVRTIFGYRIPEPNIIALLWAHILYCVFN